MPKITCRHDVDVSTFIPRNARRSSEHPSSLRQASLLPRPSITRGTGSAQIQPMRRKRKMKMRRKSKSKTKAATGDGGGDDNSLCYFATAKSLQYFATASPSGRVSRRVRRQNRIAQKYSHLERTFKFQLLNSVHSGSR